MSLIDKIKENPNLIKRVDISFHHLNNAAVTKDYLKKKIINQLASYMLKQGLIGYEEKDEDGITKIRATCYAVDIDKLKIMYDMDKEILENLKRIYSQENTFGRKLMEREFPELAESEDEKIRKTLIRLFTSNNVEDYGGATNKQIVAWLEKQGKQKSVEHFELKAGHWYFCHQAYCCRADDLTVKEGERFMCEEDGIVKGFIIKYPEKYFIEIDAPESHDKKPNPTLSEEDERMFDSIIEDVMPCGECPDYPTDEEREYFYEGYRKVRWLKLLKERFKNV